MLHGRFVTIVSLLVLCGCQSNPGARMLSLVGLGERPLVVGLACEPFDVSDAKQIINPFGDYEPLCSALGNHIGRPVGMDMRFPFQVCPSLDLGTNHFAIVSAGQFAQLARGCRVIAVSLDEKGRAARPAVVVVPADSPLQSLRELRGKRIAFGRRNDGRTHLAAMDLLGREGVPATELARELLPLPGSLRHFNDAESVLVDVFDGGADAGVIDEAAWERLPPSAPAPQASQERLRVLGRTADVPDKLVLASPTVDAACIAQVTDALTAMGESHREALSPLRMTGFQVPAAELIETCRRLGQNVEPTPDENAPREL